MLFACSFWGVLAEFYFLQSCMSCVLLWNMFLDLKVTTGLTSFSL